MMCFILLYSLYSDEQKQILYLMDGLSAEMQVTPQKVHLKFSIADKW